MQEKEGRTYAFFTFYEEGTYGYDDLVREGKQAGSVVRWITEWEGKEWGMLEEGEWKQVKGGDIVFRVPMRTSVAKLEVKRKLEKRQREEESSEESYETRRARHYLKYA